MVEQARGVDEAGAGRLNFDSLFIFAINIRGGTRGRPRCPPVHVSSSFPRRLSSCPIDGSEMSFLHKRRRAKKHFSNGTGVSADGNVIVWLRN